MTLADARPASPSRTASASRTTTTSPAATTSPSTRRSGSSAWSARRAAHHGALRGGAGRRPARCRWCWPPARRASCCTRRSATAWRPTSTARTSRSTRTRSASRSRRPSSPSSTTAPWSTRAARSTSTTRATSAGKTHAGRGRRAHHLPARPISAKHYGVKPTGNGRRESYRYAPMPRMRSTYMLPGPAQEGRDHRLGEEGHLLHQLHQRPGQHRRRRLHVLREERLPDRGRQAHPPDQGRQHHRQRPEGARARSTWSRTT